MLKLPNKKLKKESSFFIINISNKNVCLSDLALTIPAGRCYDLLNGNFSFTVKQLKESIESGSLCKKKSMVKVSRFRPQEREFADKEISKSPIITRNPSAVKIEEVVFDDLIVSDEDYANEMALEFGGDYDNND